MPVAVLFAAPKQRDGFVLIKEGSEAPSDVRRGAQHTGVVPSEFRRHAAHGRAMRKQLGFPMRHRPEDRGPQR